MSDDKKQSGWYEADGYKVHVHSNGMSDAVMQDIIRMVKWVQRIEATVCPECGAKYRHGVELKNKRLVCQCGWEGSSE